MNDNIYNYKALGVIFIIFNIFPGINIAQINVLPPALYKVEERKGLPGYCRDGGDSR